MPTSTLPLRLLWCCFFFQAEDGIRDVAVTGVQTCALPILYRMCLRQEILRITAETADARTVLLNVAAANLHTIMPAYTHTQPAQPTTLAHYLLAAVEFLGRDMQRLRAAFATVNRNPLGACAITTTGFPIDRDYTARMLGFEGLQLNSYGAIGAIDYLTETAGAIAVLMLSLGRLVQDLLVWR